MIDVEKVVDALKLPVRVFVALALATGAVLFAPVGFVETLGLAELRTDHRTWIGLTFLASSAVVVVALGVPVWKILSAELRQRWIGFRNRKHLRQLTPGEKEVLRGYLEEDTRTQAFWLANGDVRELEAHGVIRRASSASWAGGTFPYNIQPWAWDYLQEHPELLRE